MEVRKKLGSHGLASFVHQSNISLSEDGKRIVISLVQANTNLRSNAVQCREVPLRKDRRFFTIFIEAIDSGKKRL